MVVKTRGHGSDTSSSASSLPASSTEFWASVGAEAVTFPECSPVLGKNVSHKSVHLMLPLYFYWHSSPLKMIQKDVVIFGQILGSKRAHATHGILFPPKNIPDLVCISFHCKIWPNLAIISVHFNHIYACSHWEKELQVYSKFFLILCLIMMVFFFFSLCSQICSPLISLWLSFYMHVFPKPLASGRHLQGRFPFSLGSWFSLSEYVPQAYHCWTCTHRQV